MKKIILLVLLAALMVFTVSCDIFDHSKIIDEKLDAMGYSIH